MCKILSSNEQDSSPILFLYVQFLERWKFRILCWFCRSRERRRKNDDKKPRTRRQQFRRCSISWERWDGEQSQSDNPSNLLMYRRNSLQIIRRTMKQSMKRNTLKNAKPLENDVEDEPKLLKISTALSWSFPKLSHSLIFYKNYIVI